MNLSVELDKGQKADERNHISSVTAAEEQVWGRPQLPPVDPKLDSISEFAFDFFYLLKADSDYCFDIHPSLIQSFNKSISRNIKPLDNHLLLESMESQR